MGAGIQYDKSQINAQAGSCAMDLKRTFDRGATFQAWLATIPDATLINTYGFVQLDVDVLRSGFADLVQLNTLYTGGGTLAVAKDFRAFLKQLYGFGI